MRRRTLLATVGSTGAALLGGCLGCDDSPYAALRFEDAELSDDADGWTLAGSIEAELYDVDEWVRPFKEVSMVAYDETETRIDAVQVGDVARHNGFEIYGRSNDCVSGDRWRVLHVETTTSLPERPRYLTFEAGGQICERLDDTRIFAYDFGGDGGEFRTVGHRECGERPDPARDD